MQKLTQQAFRRPRAQRADMARDPKQAAMQLVRIEFEINRLERALAADLSRVALQKAELMTQINERGKLMSILSNADTQHV